MRIKPGWLTMIKCAFEAVGETSFQVLVHYLGKELAQQVGTFAKDLKVLDSNCHKLNNA